MDPVAFFRRLPLLCGAVVLTLAVAQWVRHPAFDRAEAHDRGLQVPLSASCDGGPARAALDPGLRSTYASPAWQGLAAGAPAAALQAFLSQSVLSPADRAGALRAWVEWTRILWRTRALALATQRFYLDRQLERGAPAIEGEEIFPFLRASLALQQGDEDVSSWLTLIPVRSPLAPARQVLEAIAREPLSDRHTEVEAILRWRRHARALAAALEPVGQDCPFPGAASSRLRLLADWAHRSELPAPDRWAALLEPTVPDFDLGRCDGEGAAVRIPLFDPGIYTLLVSLALDQVERYALPDAPARFFRLRALELPDPARARDGACELERAWPASLPADASGPWLMFGDWADLDEMRDSLHRLCAGELEACPGSTLELQASLEWEVKHADRCTREIQQIDPAAGAFATDHALYAGIIRRRSFGPFLRRGCAPAVADEAFGLWKEQAVPRSRWQDLETRLVDLQRDVATSRFQRAPVELQLLADEPVIGPLFSPLSTLVSHAGERVAADTALVLERARPVSGAPAATMSSRP
jgi:hypothetical protein